MTKPISGILLFSLLLTFAVPVFGVTASAQTTQGSYIDWVDTPYGHRLDTLQQNDLTITITPYNPPVRLSASGGNFKYSITVSNNEPTPITFNVWTVAILPNQHPHGPVYGPVDFHLPDSWSSTRDDLVQQVPGFAPAGEYMYIACVGIYPSEIWDSASFVLEKLPETTGWYPQTLGSTSMVSRNISSGSDLRV